MINRMLYVQCAIVSLCAGGVALFRKWVKGMRPTAKCGGNEPDLWVFVHIGLPLHKAGCGSAIAARCVAFALHRLCIRPAALMRPYCAESLVLSHLMGAVFALYKDLGMQFLME